LLEQAKKLMISKRIEKSPFISCKNFFVGEFYPLSPVIDSGFSIYRGVALSWSLSSITMVFLLFSYVKVFKLHKKTWPGKHGLSANHKQEVESVFIIKRAIYYLYDFFVHEIRNGWDKCNYTVCYFEFSRETKTRSKMQEFKISDSK